MGRRQDGSNQSLRGLLYLYLCKLCISKHHNLKKNTGGQICGGEQEHTFNQPMVRCLSRLKGAMGEGEN